MARKAKYYTKLQSLKTDEEQDKFRREIVAHSRKHTIKETVVAYKMNRKTLLKLRRHFPA